MSTFAMGRITQCLSTTGLATASLIRALHNLVKLRDFQSSRTITTAKVNRQTTSFIDKSIEAGILLGAKVNTI